MVRTREGRGDVDGKEERERRILSEEHGENGKYDKEKGREEID